MLSVIADEFGLTAAQAGAITSVYFLVYTPMQLPPGIIGDRIGLKRVLVVTYLVAGLGMLAVGLLANSYLLLMLCIGLHALGAGAYYTTAYATTMRTVPARMRGISSAIINSGMALGLALGLAVSGPVYLVTLDWRAPFVFLAVPTVGMAIVFAASLRDVRPTERVKTKISDILRDTQLLALNGTAFCSLYGFFVIITWAPTFFQTERGLSLSLAGSYTAVVAVASLPACVLLSRFSDRMGRKRVTLVLFPVGAAAIFAMAYVQTVEALLVALVVYGVFGKLTLDPILVAWVGDIVSRAKPDAMGSAIGVFSTCAISAAIVGPVTSGWIKDVTGSLEGAFYLGAAIVLCGFLFALVPRETVRRTAVERR